MPNNYTRTRTVDARLNDAGPYEAIVISHLDPRSMGTLEVEIIRHTRSGTTPQRTGQIATVRYLSPFYGTTPAEGLTANDGFQNTQKSYGMWMIPPDVGTRVLVMFVEGNSAYGYWIGCVMEEGMNFMIPSAGQASTTLTTDATPTNLKENKLPVGEYNKLIEKGEKVDPTLFKKPYNKDFTEVLEVQGLLNDEARGTTTSSARREVPSAVFGISTPGPLDKRNKHPTAKYGAEGEQADHPFNRLGGTSLVMDDGDDKFIRATHASDGPPVYINKEKGEAGGDETIPQNELFRIRTRTGHQILLHNSEDFIYISNSRGTAWIELTSDGKIDIYSYDSISINSDQDINLLAERDLNFEAGRNINMRAAARYSDGKESENGIPSGRVQIESAFSTNILAGKDLSLSMKNNFHLAPDANFNLHVKGDLNLSTDANLHLQANDNIYLKADKSFYRQAHRSIHDLVTDPDPEQDSMGYYLHAPTVDISALRHIHSTAGSDIVENAATTISNNAGESIHHVASSGINLLGGSIVAGDAGQIHWNSGRAVEGSNTLAAIALRVTSSNIDSAVDGPVSGDQAASAPNRPSPPQPLSLITLPYIIPGAQNAVSFQSIVPRAPQHEPWPHHENLNPFEFKPEGTDRERPGDLSIQSRVLTPDTFRKNKDGLATSVFVNVIGPANTDEFSNTGCGVVNSNSPSTSGAPGGVAGSGTSAGSGSGVNGYGGTPGGVSYNGQGELAPVTAGGRTVQVAKVFQRYFQGFLDDLAASGYRIRELGGYSSRQARGSTSWSYHASGAAIDINPGPNGFFKPRPPNSPITDMPVETVRRLCRKWHLGWGGDWNRISDAMHFSAAKTEFGGWNIPRNGQVPSTATVQNMKTFEDGSPTVADRSSPSKEGPQ